MKIERGPEMFIDYNISLQPSFVDEHGRFRFRDRTAWHSNIAGDGRRLPIETVHHPDPDIVLSIRADGKYISSDEVARLGNRARGVSIKNLIHRFGKDGNDMTNKDMAAQIARDRIQGTFGKNAPGFGKNVKVTPSDFMVAWEPLVVMEKDALALNPDLPTLEDAKAQMPVTQRMAVLELLGKKPAAMTESQAEDMFANIEQLGTYYKQAILQAKADAATRRAAQRDEVIRVDAEHGQVFVPSWKWDLILGGAKRGRHTLLVGVPGVGKTEVGRAVAQYAGRKFFHFEVSGFTDVSQLEVERVITSKDGAPHMELRPTPFTEALQAVRNGDRVLLLVDEIARVSDPSILNPLLLLLAQGEYHSVISKDVYNVTPDNFVLFATANDAAGYNFSGNSRRGMDEALADRLRRIELTPPDPKFIPEIVMARVKDCTPEMASMCGTVYGLAQHGNEQTADLKRALGVRGILGLADDWATLGEDWTAEEIIERTLTTVKPESKKSLFTILAALGK